MNRLMQAVRAEAAQLWDGSHLLIGGTSHGGTAPAVAIASRKALKSHAPVWTGSAHTAVALFDGISNPKTLEEWMGGLDAGALCPVFHARFVGRYGDGPPPLAHSCQNKACWCSSPAHAEDWRKDTVVIGATEPASPYVCSDFTPAAGNVLYFFASCSGAPGSGPCDVDGDIIPDEQQQVPYQKLAACAGVTATYKKYAECSHAMCGTFGTKANCGGAEAVAWLEANGW
jgi:hypothetical protein